MTLEMHKFTIKQEKNQNISICGLDTKHKITLYNVWFSTLGGGGGGGVFSTLGDIMSTSGVLNTLEGTMSASGRGIS